MGTLGNNEFKTIMLISKNEDKLIEAMELLDDNTADLIKKLSEEIKGLKTKVEEFESEDKTSDDDSKKDSKDDKKSDEDNDDKVSAIDKIKAELELSQKENKKLEDENKSLTEKKEVKPEPKVDEDNDFAKDEKFFKKL